MALAHDLEFVFDRPLSAHAQELVMDAIERYVTARDWTVASTFTFAETESGDERVTFTVETPDSDRRIDTAVLSGGRNHYRTTTPLAEWSDHDLGAFRWERSYTTSVSEAGA